MNGGYVHNILRLVVQGVRREDRGWKRGGKQVEEGREVRAVAQG